MRVPLMRNAFLNDRETRDALAEFVRTTDRLSMGLQVKAFEIAFAKWQGRKYAVMVNSGSSANLLLWDVLGRGERKFDFQVMVSSVTWSTNVMPLWQTGRRPIPMDINPETFELVGERSGPLFVTHILGYPGACYRPYMWEDCCEALGTDSQAGRLGNIGLASTFSFFVGHHLSTIEGGMICTDDEDLWRTLLMARAHGWTRDLPEYQPSFEGRFEFRTFGFNLRPTEIQGFLGLQQLPYLDDAIAKREALFDRFASQCSLIPPRPPYVTRFSPMALPFICPPGERPRWLAKFEKAGIETRPIVAGNIQRQPFWKGPKTHTPGADIIHDRGFYCTLRPDLTEQECETIEGAMHD